MSQPSTAQAAQGRRVVAAAIRVIELSRAGRPLGELAGVFAFTDPPRPGVKEAVEQVGSAGFPTVMGTAVHPVTATQSAGDRELQHDGVVHQAIDRGGGCYWILEHRVPPAEHRGWR